MEQHTIEMDDSSFTKSGDVIQHQENEKDLAESPVESVSPASDHVTAKTWIVIFVSWLSPVSTVELMLTPSQILSSTFGLSFWPVPTTAAMQTVLGTKFGDPTSTYWMSMSARFPKKIKAD